MEVSPSYLNHIAIAGIFWLHTIQCFDIFITFSVKIPALTFREPVYFALVAIQYLICCAFYRLQYRRMAVVVMSYYVILNQIFLYIYNMYISYFTNYSGKYLVKLTLSRHIACSYSFWSKILLSQNWIMKIYYDGYRRVNRYPCNSTKAIFLATNFNRMLE